MKYEIINSGSDGNCIIINGNFMIDCGVSYKRIKNILKNIKLIFISHIHQDHLNKKTIKQIAYNFPTIKFVVGSTDLVNTLVEHSNVNKKNIYALPSNKWFDLGMLKQKEKAYTSKAAVIKALADRDIKTLREISDYFYRTSGIYFRVCNYFAQMYRYDWYIVPEVYDGKMKDDEKLVDEFKKALNFLDNSYIKKVCGDIALSVIKNGAYYGIVVPSKNGLYLQELPAGYCRSRYSVGNTPAIELDMRFFDASFKDAV